MISKVLSAALIGLDPYLVEVEIYITGGLPSMSLVGLPDAAVKESRDRVVAAVRNAGFDLPPKRITVNLAPADIKKEGAAFDLPVALGILAASGSLDPDRLEGLCCIGELALNGTLRPVRGVLPIALGLARLGVKRLILPRANAAEAATARDIEVIPADTLGQVVRYLAGEESITAMPAVAWPPLSEDEAPSPDFSDVKGQIFAKRALEIAAAGGHNVIMVGPPGSGKTMLARRLPGIMPPLNFDEALETTKIHSVAGLLSTGGGLARTRPFRAPHHTVSDIALIGGGSWPRPGEVSVAHNGVLFLDELPEFHRSVLEVMRQPLEEGTVSIARARHSLVFPASFMLVAAMNPCPCGNFGHPEKQCVCTPFQVQKYRSRISGPLLDRIDLHLEVPALKLAEITDDAGAEESSVKVRARVASARAVQQKRFAGAGTHSNSRMSTRQVRAHCALNADAKSLLRSSISRLGFSARAYDRVLKVARTVADLAGSEHISGDHVAEAVQYRALDRPLFGVTV